MERIRRAASSSVMILLLAALCALFLLGGCSESRSSAVGVSDVQSAVTETAEAPEAAEQAETEKSPEIPSLTFRNADRLNEHYEKHGIEMGYASAEEYQAAAAAVVSNPDALHKTETEDGDDVYYLESTNDFVIVSTDGYIRTYFRPDAGIDYYNRQ